MLVVGQQKLSGSPSWLHGTKPVKEHVLALGRGPIACAASSVTDSAVAEEMVVVIRHIAANLMKVFDPMVVLCDD